MTAVLSLGAAVPASAQGPATKRGVVYECHSGEPVAGAQVRLVSTDGSFANIVLRTDNRGRFVRVGLPPGTYRVETSKQVGRHVEETRRLARLENDDVLEVRLGVLLMSPEGCEPYLVPPVVPTSDRYIIH
jgi:hypothetical protein